MYKEHWDLILTIQSLFRYALNGNFQDTMKGMICTKTNLSNINMNDNTQNESSYKQTLMIIFGSSILLGFTSFHFFSARKQRLDTILSHSLQRFRFWSVLHLTLTLWTCRRFYSIRKLQINLIDLRLQFIFCNLFLIRLFLDQALNISFQNIFKDIGKEDIFNVWWLSLYLEYI